MEEDGISPPVGIISLTTDFGFKDPYVGVMKGVILSIDPGAVIVDITHGISPQNILEGAFSLLQSYPYFPEGTIHVAVVDPGVGGKRRAIVIETERYAFVGPDNGVFTWVLEREDVRRVIHITRREYLLEKVSRTFHGRDVFAPVAAHLSRGVDPGRLGRPVDDPCRVPIPRPLKEGGRILGEVIYIDGFGNCITNIEEGMIGKVKRPLVRIKEMVIEGLSGAYEEGREGLPLALIGSASFLEIGVYRGSASDLFGIKTGDKVEVVLR